MIYLLQRQPRKGFAIENGQLIVKEQSLSGKKFVEIDFDGNSETTEDISRVIVILPKIDKQPSQEDFNELNLSFDEGTDYSLVLPSTLDPVFRLVKASAENGIISEGFNYNSGDFFGTDTINYRIINIKTLEELEFTVNIKVKKVDEQGVVAIEGGLLGAGVTATLTDYDGIDGQQVTFKLLKDMAVIGDDSITTGIGNTATVEFSAEFIQAIFSVGDTLNIFVSYTDEFGTVYSVSNQSRRIASVEIYDIDIDFSVDVNELGGQAGIERSTFDISFTSTANAKIDLKEEAVLTNFGSFTITALLNEAGEETNVVRVVYLLDTGENFQELDEGELATDIITITTTSGREELVTFTIIGVNDEASFTSSTDLVITDSSVVDSGLVGLTTSYSISDGDGVEQENLQTILGLVATSGELITGNGDDAVTTTITDGFADYGTLNVLNGEKNISFLNARGVDRLTANEKVVLHFTVESIDGTQLPVNVTINGGNEKPIVVNEQATIIEDTMITISVLDNDRDIEGEILSVSAVEEAENGSVRIEENKLIYSPNENFSGTEILTYTIRDGGGASTVGTVTVTVTAVEDAGILRYLGAGLQGSVLSVTLTDVDGIDGQEVTFYLVDSQGETIADTTVTQTGSATTVTGEITVPNSLITGDEISIRASYTDEGGTNYNGGENGGVNVLRSAIITVGNTAPVAVDDAVTIKEDSGETTISLFANDSDADGNDTLVVSYTRRSW